MKDDKYRRNYDIIIYGVFLVFYLWMAAQLPYTHDDWDWGTSNGIEQFLHATLNARYAGNFFAVIMTRFPLLKILIMGAGYFLIPYGLAVYAVWDLAEPKRETKLCAFLLCNILLFLLPREIWRQTYSWVAGFANYSVSAVFLLVWIREIRLAFGPESPKNSAGIWELLVCFAGSFLVQMFLENLAIYTVILGIFLCGVHFYRNKKIPLKSGLMLLGAALGLFVMFSSSIYGSLWSTGEAVNGYRSLSVGTQYSLTTTIYMLLSQAAVLAPLIFEKNVIQCLVVLGLLSSLLLQKERKTLWTYGFCAVNGLFGLYVVYGYCKGDAIAELGGLIPLVVNAALFLTVAVETVYLLHGKKFALGVALTAWTSVPGVILPLVFTLETGERLFLTSNVFFILFAALLLREQLDTCNNKKTAGIFLVVSLLLMCFYGYIYHGIGQCKRQRDALMVQAAERNAASLTLPNYPHGDYLWGPNPNGEKRQAFFREFYQLPEYLEIYIQQ